MPKNFDFVLAAYLITGVMFAGYLIHLWRKERNIRSALKRLASSGSDASGGQAGGETDRT